MAERGFAATSIGSICTATGLAPTAIYWHFGSKDGLLAAIVERSIERWYAELVEAMGGEPAEGSEDAVPPAADLQRFFRVMLDAYRHQPQALRLMLWLGLDRGHPDQEVRAAVQQARRRAIALIAASIGRALGPAEHSPQLSAAYDQLARLLLVQLDGIFVAHEVDDDGDRIDELFELAHTAVVAAGIEVIGRATHDPTSESHKEDHQ
jgi:AcrR family transcriptional regulator